MSLSVPKRENYTGKSPLQRRWGPRLSLFDLESASGARWVLARAVAVALDLDVGQLGDGDDRDGGVKSDAEITVSFRKIGKKAKIKLNLL